MEVHDHRGVKLHISPDKKRDFKIESTNDLEERVLDSIERFVETNPEHRKYIEKFSEAYRLFGTIILDAHGTEVKGKYMYYDGGAFYTVQDWINKHDGQAAVLLLRCCNPSSLEIQSKKSIVLVPNNTFSEKKQDMGETTVEIYVPNKGYLDSYTIDHALAQLKPSP